MKKMYLKYCQHFQVHEEELLNAISFVSIDPSIRYSVLRSRIPSRAESSTPRRFLALRANPRPLSVKLQPPPCALAEPPQSMHTDSRESE
jgi:hypothetical protein